MEYILIFITAIFVNNVVLSQFLGICPFLGVCIGRFRIGIFADYSLYPCHCRIGSDGRNYLEKGFSFFVSGTGSVPAFDYN